MQTDFVFFVGGRSTEHDASLHSYFAFREEILLRHDYRKRAVGVLFISRTGSLTWHEGSSLPSTATGLEEGLSLSWPEFLGGDHLRDRFVFNLLHGNEGEDGAIQGMAEILNWEGSFESVFASSFTMSKWAQAYSASLLSESLVCPPRTWIITRDMTRDRIMEICGSIGSKLVIKPNSMGASIHTYLYDHSELENILEAIRNVLVFDTEALIQVFISGIEYTCGCIRVGDVIHALPVLSPRTSHSFLGHAEKHIKGLIEVEYCDDKTIVIERVKEISKTLFSRLGLFFMARFDFIYAPAEDRFYFLECNSIPGFSHGSAFPAMLSRAGYTRLDFLDICIANVSLRQRRIKTYSYNIEH